MVVFPSSVLKRKSNNLAPTKDDCCTLFLTAIFKHILLTYRKVNNCKNVYKYKNKRNQNADKNLHSALIQHKGTQPYFPSKLYLSSSRFYGNYYVCLDY